MRKYLIALLFVGLGGFLPASVLGAGENTQTAAPATASSAMPATKIAHAPEYLGRATGAGFETVDQLASYCFGYRLGQRFKQDPLEGTNYRLIDNLFMEGMTDGYLGKQAKLTQHDLTSALNEFKTEMREAENRENRTIISETSKKTTEESTTPAEGKILEKDADMDKTAAELAKTAAARTLSSAEANSLNSREGKFSYAIGFQTGAAFNIGIRNDPTLDEPDEFNDELFLGGFKLGFMNGPLPIGITPEIMSDLLYIWHNERTYEKEAAFAVEGLEWLQSNAKKDGVKVLENGLQYKILEAGNPESRIPKPEDAVLIIYRGTLIDDKEWDNSGGVLRVSMNELLPGVAQGLTLLHEGGKAIFYIPSDLGYGAEGRPGQGTGVPPYATLIVEIELKQVIVGGGKTSEPDM